jgi:bifunctional DNase/RNase
MTTKSCSWLILLSLMIAPAHAAQNSALVETRVKTLVLDPATQAPVVILETVSDRKLLPIWIAAPEARAIAIALENVKLPRPLTHDLIGNLLQALDAKLKRVVISELRNDTFIAFLLVESKGKNLQVDSRPSDAIAIALRMKAPIFASAQVLAGAKSMPVQPTRAEQTQTRLGIQAQELTAELAGLFDSSQSAGMIVAEVMPAGAAIIVKANDRKVTSLDELESLVQSVQPQSQLKLDVLRKGKPTNVVIDLAS